MMDDRRRLMSSGMDSSIDGSEEMAYKDPPKTKAQQQASYIKHPEERPAANRKYYLEHVGQTNAHRRRYCE
jgi:hypothetical protein